MPKTTPSESTNNRFNPYITKSISKTLLTPCRQVGLSRKKKTPNSAPTASSSDVSINDSSGSVTLNTTPVTSRHSSSESPSLSQETNLAPKLIKNSDKVKTKRSVSKCLIADDDTSLISSKTENSDQFVKSPSEVTEKKSDLKHGVIDEDEESVNLVALKSENSKGTASEKTVKSSNRGKAKKSVSKCLLIDDEDNFAEKISYKENNSSKTALDKSNKSPDKVTVKKPRSKRTILDDEDNVNFVKMKKSMSKPLIIDDDEDDEDHTNLTLKTEKTLHTDVSVTDSDFDISPVMKPNEKLRQYENKLKKRQPALKEIQNSVNTEEIKEKSRTQLSSENTPKHEKKAKMKRSLSLKKSAEEIEEIKKYRSNSDDFVTQDCDVVLSPLESKQDLEPPIFDVFEITELEKDVQKKRKLLEDLQQAEIYRKLHDVDKLQELTATWKNGCIAALNDLLPHVQAHADIDMPTLLKNLRVPDKLITLSQNGDLV